MGKFMTDHRDRKAGKELYRVYVSILSINGGLRKEKEYCQLEI